MARIEPQASTCLSCVVAGHVDHGKSTLIGCLARELHSAGITAGALDVAVNDPAFFTDRLQEEREGKMTVDSAAVRFDLPFGHLTLVDVPGHAEFLRSMLTGTTHATVGVLVVAADEGIRPQTVVHARLMALCGIRRVVLAITKMDLAGWRQGAYENVRSQAEALLTGLGMEATAAVPVAVLEGTNVLVREGAPPWCEGTLLDAFQAEMQWTSATVTPATCTRFAVQHVQRLPGLPPLCVGRVLGGHLAEGDTLWQVGDGRRLKVKRIARFPECRDAAKPGESVALEFAGSAMPSRGDVLEAAPRCTAFSSHLEARVAWLDPRPSFPQLRSQWLFQALPIQIAGSQPSHLPDATGQCGVLHISNSALQIAHPRPISTFEECSEMGRFVLWDSGKMVGAGVVTGYGDPVQRQRGRSTHAETGRDE